MNYDRAVQRSDTIMMSVPDAELFTKNYKMMYPSGNGFAGGGWLRKYETGGPKIQTVREVKKEVIPLQ